MREMPVNFDKYKSFLKEGKARYEIDACLREDSLSPEDIASFWQHARVQALEDAVAHTPADDIGAVWRRIQPYQYYQRGFSLPHVPARKQPGDLRVVFISDTHSLHDELPPIPDGDLLIHGGDFTDTGDRDEVRAFNDFLGKLPHRYKVVIAGNHETTFEKAYYSSHWKRYGHPVEYDSDDVRSLLTNAVYLEDMLITVEGYRIYGCLLFAWSLETSSPWQPAFCDWAFNLPRGSDELKAKWAAVPSNVDVLVTHSPPMGRGDDIGILRVGDVHLLHQVQERIKPAFHLFGHGTRRRRLLCAESSAAYDLFGFLVHEGYGATFDGTTIFVNGSNCTEEYKAINPIVVFDLPPRMAAAVDDATDYHTRMAQQQQLAQRKVIHPCSCCASVGLDVHAMLMQRGRRAYVSELVSPPFNV
ncbi:hypothetical protein DYB32_009085 [Aphanomyces invadans]|uniref:Calcineurin-like phosphoesterase domain-containing protein n=1 Tax=Aphanomyces invadans TaxID=157072 RepID=A0A418AJU7_9STRA|nr:hypothetical protein DYB32_009085 [Aphanomyces invadans]